MHRECTKRYCTEAREPRAPYRNVEMNVCVCGQMCVEIAHGQCQVALVRAHRTGEYVREIPPVMGFHLADEDMDCIVSECVCVFYFFVAT